MSSTDLGALIFLIFSAVVCFAQGSTGAGVFFAVLAALAIGFYGGRNHNDF